MQNKNYVLKEYMLSFDQIDAEVDQMLQNHKLLRKTNDFFVLSKKMSEFPMSSCIHIAHNWFEITRQFLFTVLTSVGVFSEKIRELDDSPYHLMNVLQSSVKIISDDLMNMFPTLQEVAPKGAAGSHFQWWEDSVLNVLIKKANVQDQVKKEISPNVQTLLNFMVTLSKEPMGAAVQLRIVEAIALDIVLAFRAIYSSLTYDNQKVFPNLNDLAWINAHIKAEVVHHRQVKDEENGGMVLIASTPEEQRKFLVLTKEYIECWSGALHDFEKYLKNEHKLHLVADTSEKKLKKSSTVSSNDQKFVEKKWRCVLCDFIYDESVGMPDEGISAGTKFEDIPDDWFCPDCGVGKSDFELMGEA